MKILDQATKKVNDLSQAKNVVEGVEISECEKILHVKWADGHKSKLEVNILNFDFYIEMVNNRSLLSNKINYL